LEISLLVGGEQAGHCAMSSAEQRPPEPSMHQPVKPTGLKVGDLEGLAVGLSVGGLLGEDEGAVEGFEDGGAVGCWLGEDEGE